MQDSHSQTYEATSRTLDPTRLYQALRARQLANDPEAKQPSSPDSLAPDPSLLPEANLSASQPRVLGPGRQPDDRSEGLLT